MVGFEWWGCAAELRRHEHALLGIREALRKPGRGDADVVGERDGDDGGHGQGAMTVAVAPDQGWFVI